MLSRVADALYWMGRYLERAEHTARLNGVALNLTLEESSDDRGRWRRLLDCLGASLDGDAAPEPYAVTERLTFAAANPSSVVASVAAARSNARHVREEVSTEVWERLNGLYHELRGATMEAVWEGEPEAYLRSLTLAAQGLQGVIDATMLHQEGWRFIQVGRHLERLGGTARLLRVEVVHLLAAEGGTVADDLDLVGLLKSCTAFEAYCKVHSAELAPGRVVELLVLQRAFPHSLAFAAAGLAAELDAIRRATPSRGAAALTRLAGRLAAGLTYGEVDEILAAGAGVFLGRIGERCAAIHREIQRIYVHYPIAEELLPR